MNERDVTLNKTNATRTKREISAQVRNDWDEQTPTQSKQCAVLNVWCDFELAARLHGFQWRTQASWEKLYPGRESITSGQSEDRNRCLVDFLGAILPKLRPTAWFIVLSDGLDTEPNGLLTCQGIFCIRGLIHRPIRRTRHRLRLAWERFRLICPERDWTPISWTRGHGPSAIVCSLHGLQQCFSTFFLPDASFSPYVTMSPLLPFPRLSYSKGTF